MSGWLHVGSPLALPASATAAAAACKMVSTGGVGHPCFSTGLQQRGKLGEVGQGQFLGVQALVQTSVPPLSPLLSSHGCSLDSLLLAP